MTCGLIFMAYMPGFSVPKFMESCSVSHSFAGLSDKEYLCISPFCLLWASNGVSSTITFETFLTERKYNQRSLAAYS